MDFSKDFYEYFSLAIFIALAGIVSFALGGLPFLLTKSQPNREKNSPYECGFNPIKLSRGLTSVKFYLVALIFVIFDMEIAFVFPWVVNLKYVGAFGFWSMIVFLSVLTIGFIYEWSKGVLDWK